MISTRSAALLALLFLSSTANADPALTGVTLSPGLGITGFDSTRNIDSDAHLSLGIGYRFDNPWAAELTIHSVQSESKLDGRSADVDFLSLDALYRLPTLNSWQPFLLVGVGEASADNAGNSRDEALIDVGAGLLYPLSTKSALRADLRLYRETGGDDNLDTGLAVSYQYSFGRAGKAVDGDDDNDGIGNSLDLCANTPYGAPVDENGCRTDGDADRDGVADSRDLCADSPLGVDVDADGCPINSDGVPDSRDRCPGTASGETVDENGCPEDDDGDGVRNAADRCPRTPADVSVDADGCPDDDGDGVGNHADECPGTPPGIAVDSRGCGPDADRDAVPDHRDECPETFPPALIDDAGCYLLIEQVVRITLDVEFDFDKATSRPEHAVEVGKVAEFMAKYPLTEVVLEGHTDSRGSDAYNEDLSKRRAATIGRMLIDRFGVDGSRVSTVGYGESRPVAPNDTVENRQRNRRVVAEISATEQVIKRSPASQD